MNKQARKKLNRRQSIEPVIGHVKNDHGMRRCWLKGAMGDALHAISCAIGYNIRWLMRAIARLGITSFFVLVFLRLLFTRWLTKPLNNTWQPA